MPPRSTPYPKPDTQGRTEAIIGSWLASRKTRDKVLIATKVAGRGKMTWLRKDGSLTRQNEAQIVEAVDASLARLKSDHIDLYQLHWPDRPMRIFEGHDYVHLGEEKRPVQMILGTLGKLVDAGKVRFIGLSNETSWGVMTFLKCAELHGLPRGALPPGSRKTLFDRLGRYEMGNGSRAISTYVALARKHGLDPAQMAIAFAVSRPFATSTIIGATTLAQLKTDIDAADLRLPDEVLADIEQIHLDMPNPCP